MAKEQITKLENGLTVVTVQQPTLQPYINLAVAAGSRDESDREAGISHFLEHMLASDTEFHSDAERALMVQKMRGVGNASTDYEDTNYYYRVNRQHIAEAMKLLADGIQHPLMSDKKIESERGAILAEMRAAFSDPDEIGNLLFMGTAFAGSSLERDIGGNLENIARFTKQDLQDYMRKHYTSDNMVLTVAGDVDHAEICKMAEGIFDSLPRSTSPAASEKQPAPVHYRGGYATKNSKESDEITFDIGFETPGNGDSRAAVKNMLLSGIMGGDFNSKLMVKLRNETGLVYSVYAEARQFRDVGLFQVEAGLEQANARQAVQLLCEELKQAVTSITQEELDGVRDMIAGMAERSVEKIEPTALRASSQLLHLGKTTPIEETLKLLDSITLEEIQDYAQELFTSTPTVSAFGNGVKKVPSYEEITGWLGKPRQVDKSGLAIETAPDGAERSASRVASLLAIPHRLKERSAA